jgi:hypothetical protein
MPILARCPNPSCGQTLQVDDQYAGRQANCPSCGTVVTFQASSPGAPPPAPPPAPPAPPPGAYTAPPAQAPAVGSFAPPPGAAPAGTYPAAPYRGEEPPAGPPMDPAKLVEMICVPAGLFFLALTLLACFLPWTYTFDPFRPLQGGLHSLNGFYLREAGFFFALCLIVTALSGITYLFRQLLPLAAVVGAGFGCFAFLFFIASVITAGRYGGVHAGVWLGLVSAVFIAGAFITLALFHPLESPLTQSLSAPLLKRHGALFLAIASGVVLGFLYLVLAALAYPSLSP